MEWNEIITNRKNSYAWTDKIPDRSIILEIISEIHRFCPSKQRKVLYHIDLIQDNNYNHNLRLYNFLLENKILIQSEVTKWIRSTMEKDNRNFSTNEYDESKCTRDIGYIISAFANDVKYNTNKYTCQAASRYFKNGIPQVKQKIEVHVYKFIKELLLKLLEGNDTDYESISLLENRINILIDVIQYGPSKLPNEIEGVNNLKHDIFYGTDRKGDSYANDLRNPQVLSPWLLVFSMRLLDDYKLNTELLDYKKARNVSQNEIGLASMFAALSATSKGLDSGFCACIRNGAEISKRLGHKPGEDTLLYLGLGYASDSKKYFNPIIHTYLDIPDKEVDQKPLLESYFKIIKI